jgi:amino acid transporter
MKQPSEQARTNPGTSGSITSEPVDVSGNGQVGSEGPATEPTGRPPLGLWDAVSIIVGIVIGSGIYQTAPFILMNLDGPIAALLTWAAAGVLSLIGALCYAELATAYPRDGGDIVYLSRAFGKWMGFQFGWVQLTVILTGSIGMMSFVFANYALRLVQAYGISLDGDLLGISKQSLATFGFAGGSVLVLSLTNIAGVVFGKTTQNILSLAKVLGLLLLVVAGFSVPHPGAWTEPVPPPPFSPSLGLALVLILYTFGGWNDAAFVAAEVRNGKKNITRALILGIFIITALYLLVNAAYINSLGYEGARGSEQVAADVLQKGLGRDGVAIMCSLVMISALGAINGLVFTGARIYSTIGKDYPILSWMSGWNRKHAAPVPALVTQGLITLLLLFLVGTSWGRHLFNVVLEQARITTIKWSDSAEPTPTDAFNTLLACTAPVFWGFFLLTGISVFVLRERDSATERPFKVPFYPELPLIFCLSCSYMLYSSLQFALFKGWQGGLLLLGVVPLLIGMGLYRISGVRAERSE